VKRRMAETVLSRLRKNSRSSRLLKKAKMQGGARREV